jgi:hypothetical protein
VSDINPEPYFGIGDTDFCYPGDIRTIQDRGRVDTVLDPTVLRPRGDLDPRIKEFLVRQSDEI